MATTSTKKAPAKTVAKRAPKNLGRPTKLTEEVQEKILGAVRAGIWLDQAAALAGIAASSLYLWADKGQRALELAEVENRALTPSEAVYADFSESLKKARAEAEARNITLVQQAASAGTWQAAAWFLERSFPNRWGRKDRMEVTGKDGGAMEVTVTAADLEAKVIALIGRQDDEE